MAVTRCARSAHTRPIRTTLSPVDSWIRFVAWAAARRRAIFCCGVSPLGADAPILICEPEGWDGEVALEAVGLEEKLVGVVAELDGLADT